MIEDKRLLNETSRWQYNLSLEALHSNRKLKHPFDTTSSICLFLPNDVLPFPSIWLIPYVFHDFSSVLLNCLDERIPVLFMLRNTSFTKFIGKLKLMWYNFLGFLLRTGTDWTDWIKNAFLFFVKKGLGQSTEHFKYYNSWRTPNQ